LKGFAAEIAVEPSGFPQMLVALDFAIGPSYEVVLAGEENDATLRAMLAETRRAFVPNKIVLLRRPGAAGARLEALAPFVKDKDASGGKATAYVCRNHACSLPVTAAEEVRKLLNERPRHIKETA
jgi:uncharacterized protein YyaL (SSP411 family)